MSELPPDLFFCRQPWVSVIAFAFDDSFILFPLDKATMAPSSLVKIEDGLCTTVQGPGQNSSVCTMSYRWDLQCYHPNPPFW